MKKVIFFTLFVAVSSLFCFGASFAQICSYSLISHSRPFSVSGGMGRITVYTSDNCEWQAVTDVPWISVTSGSSEIGNGRITFAVSENTGKTERAGNIIVEDRAFGVTQASQDIDLHYHLIIDNPSSHRAKVKMTVKNVYADVFRIQERCPCCDFGIEVLTLTAKDIQGNPLIVDSFPAPIGDTYYGDEWVIHCAGLTEFVIEYTTEPKKISYLAKEFYATYVDTDFAVFTVERLFLLPVNYPPLRSLA